MKKITLYLFITTLFLTLSSCEKVIDLELDTAPPKLVIDASIKWQRGTTGSYQKIKLTTTTSYFSYTIPIVSGANVVVENSSNTVFNFTELNASGEYICNNFIPVINETYKLTVTQNGQTYTATEKLYSTSEIEDIEQKTVSGFDGDQIQVKFLFQDNGSENNYYLTTFKQNNIAVPEFFAESDEFYQGNKMFGFYTEDSLKPGNILDMSVQGISKKYYNFMQKLISISGNGGGNPFSTPPAALIGNIKNQTDTNNPPLGFFSLGEVDTKVYTVQ
ncbi:DUF4249 domain-containing protein [Flavobacterium sp.]|uniref:DUF4249 domain-containing protein n=1 Tax=Flavobacterium sp. TaxID=239 RepID=UPI00286E0CBC|nr:DUF4249 domain-containing protein [Flavobacterium sp.]